MMRLSGFLSGQLDRPVVDETSLKALFNFTLKAPMDLRENQPAKSDGQSPDSLSSGAFIDGLRALGLQLLPGTAQVEYLVVDHVEKPTGN
jgi:uncharacterized protein (TIGR03435 family)